MVEGGGERAEAAARPHGRSLDLSRGEEGREEHVPRSTGRHRLRQPC
jgi:hypothetical protein